MEDYNREFKIDIPKKQSALKAEIVSFLNSTNGEIYLGVDDSGIIQNDLINEKKKKWEELLSNWIVNAFNPDVTNLIYIYPNETPFRIKILRGKERPYFYKDGEGFNTKGVYVRVGSTKRLASFDEIQRMIRQHSQHDYERLLCYREDLTFNYLENRFKEKGVLFDKYALSLIDKDNKYNNAALFKKQPEYYISDNGVIVTLFNRNYDIQNDGQNDGQKISASNRLKNIIKYIESDSAMTADRLKNLLNVSKRTIERDIEKLRKDNKIEYTGSAKDGRWIVKGQE